MRRLLLCVMGTTVAATFFWTTITFFGDSTKLQKNYETNETMTVEIPRLMLKSWYPWNPVGGMIFYFATLGFQFYYLLFSMVHSNSADVLFCSWVLFACEQLQHLKVTLKFNLKYITLTVCNQFLQGIMRPLMELSATLDTYRPNSAALFRSISAGSKSDLIINEGLFKSFLKRNLLVV